MAVVKYKPNPLFEQEVQLQPEHEKGMVTITKKVAAVIRRVAPHKTGYYERRVNARGTRIRTLDNMWHIVEWGAKGKSRAYAPIRRGIRAAGLKFKLLPKP